MFVILATKPLNDGTSGFRFNILGNKGIYRKRKIEKRYGKSQGDCMTGYHFGKRILYVEGCNFQRALHNLAG